MDVSLQASPFDEAQHGTMDDGPFELAKRTLGNTRVNYN